MLHKDFEREKMYQAAMHVFRRMVRQGILSEEDYAQAERMMEEKYHPMIGRLLSSL